MGSIPKKLSASAAAPNTPYFIPHQDPPAGTALEGQNVPTVFQPLTIRGHKFTNRFVVAPMCMYSADDGHLTDYHLVHLGAYAFRGAALTITEAAAVTPNGRISPEDAGLWQDSQIAPYKRVADFVHAQGQLLGIQLAHAGRKASTLAPWHASPADSSKTHVAGPEVGGWPDNVWGPSAINYKKDDYPEPKEMTLDQIKECVEAFAAAAKRSVKAGIDVIEIHGAHGYLISNFLSPLSNQRTDQYGGSYENRIRFLIEITEAIRAVIPKDMPLFLRISATEWMEWAHKDSWDVPQSIKLAHQLTALGVDLLDVSSGGNSSEQKINIHPYYQIDIAGEIRDSLRKAEDPLLIGALGMITTPEMARDIVEENGDKKHDDGKLVTGGVPNQEKNGEVDEQGAAKSGAKGDMIIMARQYLREPEFVLRAARKLGVKVQWPLQYGRASEHWDV